MIKKNLLILGSNSFLSSYLIKDILKQKKKYNLYLFSRDKKTFKLNSLKSISKFIIKNKINYIINCIANTNIEECEKSFSLAYNSNVKSILNFKKIIDMPSSPIEGFIHISTDHIYNKPKSQSYENDNLFLENNYALTKYIAEKIIESKKTLILRTNFFGFKNDYLNKNPGWILKNIKMNQKVNGYCNVRFNPMHAATLSKTILIIIENFKNGTYNLGSINSLTKYDFLKNVFKACNIDINLIQKSFYENDIVNRPLNMSMNTYKFKKAFKIKLPKLQTEILKLKNEYQFLINEI